MCAPYRPLPSPGFEAPSRFVKKFRTGKTREDGGTRVVECPSTECGKGSPVELLKIVGTEGHAAATLGPEFG